MKMLRWDTAIIIIKSAIMHICYWSISLHRFVQTLHSDMTRLSSLEMLRTEAQVTAEFLKELNDLFDLASDHTAKTAVSFANSSDEERQYLKPPKVEEGHVIGGEQHYRYETTILRRIKNVSARCVCYQ